MPFALRPGQIIGSYTIDRVMGSDSLSFTYEATHSILRGRFAIKEFFPQQFASREHESSSDVVYRSNHAYTFERAVNQFEQSAKALYTLNHPNIVRVVEYTKENATRYIITDFVEGQTLERWLCSRRSPPPEAIFEQIFDALEYVHLHKMIHGDIAPSNIVLNSYGLPVLTDFTMIATSSLIEPRQHYSPPERTAVALGALPAIDVYSAAAVLYRVLTGAPPIDAHNRALAVADGRGDTYVPLASVSALASSAARAIDRALSLRAADRPQTIRELRPRFHGLCPVAP